jgi:tripartite-type tricarboxylate transporter receptor subunit TctC
MLSRYGRHLFRALAMAVMAVALPVPDASAQDAASFYKGKTVRFIVSTGPGGGFDAYARMLAPHIEKATGATVVVQNMPGAGGLVANNHVYTEKADDSLTMMILNGNNAAMAQLVGDPAVKFDTTKFNILGLIVTSPWMWIASPKSKMQKLEDFLKPGAQITWSGSGQMGGISDGAAVTCEALKLNCKIVRGYNGSAQGALALARGETDAMYVSDGSANNYVKNGSAKPVVAVTHDRSAYFPNVPTVFEAIKLKPEQKWWFEFRAAIDNIQRMLAMPPNVPKAHVAYMQQVTKKILTDPAVIAEGKKTQRFIEYKDPATVKKMVDTVLVSTTAQQKKTVKEVILRE